MECNNSVAIFFVHQLGEIIIVIVSGFLNVVGLFFCRNFVFLSFSESFVLFFLLDLLVLLLASTVCDELIGFSYIDFVVIE